MRAVTFSAGALLLCLSSCGQEAPGLAAASVEACLSVPASVELPDAEAGCWEPTSIAVLNACETPFRLHHVALETPETDCADCPRVELTRAPPIPLGGSVELPVLGSLSVGVSAQGVVAGHASAVLVFEISETSSDARRELRVPVSGRLQAPELVRHHQAIDGPATDGPHAYWTMWRYCPYPVPDLSRPFRLFANGEEVPAVDAQGGVNWSFEHLAGGSSCLWLEALVDPWNPPLRSLGWEYTRTPDCR